MTDRIHNQQYSNAKIALHPGLPIHVDRYRSGHTAWLGKLWQDRREPRGPWTTSRQDPHPTSPLSMQGKWQLSYKRPQLQLVLTVTNQIIQNVHQSPLHGCAVLLHAAGNKVHAVGNKVECPVSVQPYLSGCSQYSKALRAKGQASPCEHSFCSK